jgi:hypothetical protein
MKPVGRHESVEFGDVRQIDPHILRGRAADPLDDAGEIGGERLILDEEVRAGNLLLDPLILSPEALLVGLGRPVARLDERRHRMGGDSRLGGADQAGAARTANTAQQRAPRQ